MLTAVLEELDKGGIICYGPVTGGLLLLNKERNLSPTPINIDEFLQLREEKKIYYTGTMNQGHHILHGRVDFYKKGATS